MSLRLRLTLVYTTFLALVLVVVAGGVYALTERSLLMQLEDRLNEITRLFVGSETLDDAREALRASYPELRIETGFYVTRRPETVAELANPTLQTTLSGDLRTNPFSSSETMLWSRLNNRDLEELLRQRDLSLRLTAGGRLWLARLRLLEHPLVGAGGEGPSISAAHLIALPTTSIQPILSQLSRDLITTVVVAFILFGVGVWWLSHQALLPVKRVTAAAAGIGVDDLAQRVPVPTSKDEMRELAQSINHMLARLQESFETQRRFTADASHELRTPVTAISGHASYLLRRTQVSPEQLESLQVIRSESERMAKLVNDLLELARADAGFAISLEPMNLVEVVEGVAKDVKRSSGDTQVTVSVPSPIVEVLGDPNRLKQVVHNLVQNAINAGSKHVDVSLQKDAGGVTLEVLDDGPGIPEAAIPHLFDRFYRVDSARSTRGNGSGLGLAIVKWIVTQHGGDVQVTAKVGEGSVFTVRLPPYDGHEEVATSHLR